MSLLPKVRRLLHGAPARRAAEAEGRDLAAHRERSAEPLRRLRAAYGAEGRGTVALGHAVEHGWDARLPAERLAAHMLVNGPSGSGKSYFLCVLLQGLLREGVRSFAVLDPKAETVELGKAVVAGAARGMPASAREALLGRVVLLDLFGSESLPRLNVLAPVPGLDEETHAYQIALLLTAEMDQGVGVRQEAILFLVLRCLLRAGLPITALPTALEAPVLLERLAESCGPAELFRAAAQRLRRESKERVLGLVSRAERVLRLRATRLALGAPDCLDFGRLLELVALVNLSPPMGAADISRVLSGLFWMGISQAIRRRPNGAPCTHLVIDEAPTFLAAAGAQGADGLEDLLRLARSKGVHLAALTQDLASIAKVSPSLPETLRTNMHLVALFRCLADSHWDFILPVTGRRGRPEPAPWEERKGGFLERPAELQLLRGELARLPDRQCFLADRRTGLPGIRLRTAELRLAATAAEVAALEAAAGRHPMLASVRDLERAADATSRRVAALLDVREGRLADGEAAPLRRARGKLDIG